MEIEPPRIVGADSEQDDTADMPHPDTLPFLAQKHGTSDAKQKQDQWLEENLQAIHCYNVRVEVYGTFGDGERSF